MKIRRVVSLTMLLCFAVMIYTGVMLFLMPHGRVAYWTQWTLLGLDKDQYGEIHTTFMALFIVTGVWHVVLNWKNIKTYLKNRTRELKVFTPEFNVSLLLVVVFLAGTLGGVAPWSTFLDWGESIKDGWETRDGSPPWGHAEESPLNRFVRRLVDWEAREQGRTVDLTVEDAVAALRAAGLEVADDRQRLDALADANGTTPQAIMEILRQAATVVSEAPEPAHGLGHGGSGHDASATFPRPHSGLGRMTVRAYAEQFGLDLDRVIAAFPPEADAGPDDRFRDLARTLDTDPEGVLEQLNAGAR